MSNFLYVAGKSHNLLKSLTRWISQYLWAERLSHSQWRYQPNVISAEILLCNARENSGFSFINISSLTKLHLEPLCVCLLFGLFLDNIREAFKKKKSTELWFFPNRGGGGLDQTPQNQTHILKCPNHGPLEAGNVCV